MCNKITVVFFTSNNKPEVLLIQDLYKKMKPNHFEKGFKNRCIVLSIMILHGESGMKNTKEMMGKGN